jgi:hypothetical protein
MVAIEKNPLLVFLVNYLWVEILLINIDQF